MINSVQLLYSVTKICIIAKIYTGFRYEPVYRPALLVVLLLVCSTLSETLHLYRSAMGVD